MLSGVCWREEDGILPKLLRLFETYYSSTRTRVRATDQETAIFEVQSDVRQGDNMFPTLFKYTIDFAWCPSGGNLYLIDLTYANDVPFLGDSTEAVQDALDNIDRLASGGATDQRIKDQDYVSVAMPRGTTNHQPWWCTPGRG